MADQTKTAKANLGPVTLEFSAKVTNVPPDYTGTLTVTFGRGHGAPVLTLTPETDISSEQARKP